MSSPAQPQVVTIDPCSDGRWEALVSRHPASVFHSPPWLRVLGDTYDLPVRARALVNEHDVAVAGLPYIEFDDFLDPRIASLPFSDFCDPIVDDLAAWHSLVDDLVARRCRIDLRCLHQEVPARDDRFAVVGQAGWHGIDLNRDLDDIWAGIGSSARRAIRKADAADVRIDVAKSESEVRDFFDLHLGIRKYKYRLLAQPYRFFQRIWEEFLLPGNGFLLLANLDGSPIGGILFLQWGDTLYYKFNASHLTSLAVRPNDRLIWEGITMGKERGLQLLDFGLSDLDQEGLVRYKRKYATEEKTITLLRHRPTESASDADQLARRVLGQLTGLLTDDSVPDDVTAKAGDVLYRFFS